MFRWLRNERGRSGLLAGVILWVMSAGALTRSMQANLAASVQEQVHDFGSAGPLIRQLHGAAVGWAVGFTLLQLMSMLLITFILRACYQLRTAICFVGGTGFVMFGDLLGLLGLLVWLGTTLGVG